MAKARRLEATMDAIALATADGMMQEAKGAAGVDLAMELQCECPHPNICCILYIHDRER